VHVQATQSSPMQPIMTLRRLILRCFVARTVEEYKSAAERLAGMPRGNTIDRQEAGQMLGQWGLSVHAASKMMWEAGRMNVVVAEYDRRG